MKKFILTLLFFSNLAVGQTLSPDGMTQIMNGQDDSVSSITLGHTFPYYDGVFTNAWMSTNGFIMLYDPVNSMGNQTTSSWCCNGYDLSNYTATDGRFSYMLAPMWTDLKDYNQTTDDGYYYETGTGGSSFLWYNVKEYGTSNNNTFQVDLWPDGSFDFVYDDVNITNHSTFIGFTGPFDSTTNNFQYEELLYKSRSEGGITIDHIDLFASQGTSWYGQDGGYELDCTNALNWSSCAGYEQAYFDYMCEADVMYNPECPGYASASTVNDITEDITGQDYVYGDEVSDFYEIQAVEEEFYFEEEEYADTGFDNTESNQGDEGGSYGETGTVWDDTEFQDEPTIAEETEEVYGDSLSRSDTILGGDPDREISEEIVVVEELEVFEEEAPVEEPVIVVETEEVFIEEVEEPVATVNVNAIAIALDTATTAQEKSVETVLDVAVETVQQRNAVNVSDVRATKQQEVVVIVEETEETDETITTESNINISFGSIDNAFANATFDMIVDPTITLSEVAVVESSTEQTTQEETTDFQMESSTPQMDTGFAAQQDQSFSTGQSITAVLNNVAPNFSQFDVAPPSQQEQQTTQKAETQANNMSEEQIANNLQDFTEEMQDSGGFTDQSLTIFLLGRVEGFENYGGQLQDVSFYTDRGLPSGRVQNDRNIMLQLIGTSGKHEEMIAEQYR